MTREELKEKIAEEIDASFVGIFYSPTPNDRERIIMEYADQILALLKEEGWKSPEEVEESKEGRMNELRNKLQIILLLSGYSIDQKIDQILALFEGYMSFDDLKGLYFEAQAKKCANCPKNQEGK